MTFTPWHIWAAFLLDLVFGDPEWVPRPRSAVLKGVHFLEDFLKERGVLKIGEKRAGILLTLSVVFLTSGVSAGLIFLGSKLHSKIELVVLLYLAYTTLKMRSFGDQAYAVLQWLQKKNLPCAREELSRVMSYNTGDLTEAEVIRSTVLAVAENSTDGVVAPLFYLVLGGVPLAMAYKAIHTLYFAMGKTDPLYRGWGFASAQFYNLANWFPARITGVLMVVGATFLFGTGSKTFMIFLRNGLKRSNPNAAIPEVVAAGAIGMTLRNPSADVAVLPIFPLHEDEIDAVQSHHIKDAIKLMGAVACIMLILCMVI
ncbi:MAG: cobalamin biosynthesis protein [Nitrospirae bacterium]|nr:cobalamin biosynthesis protein [Candidatus Troglogloeales bacterium]